MLKKIANMKGAVIIDREAQESIHGGLHNCNVARKCLSDIECCSGVCGVEKIILGKPVIISVCAL